jgi:(S)-citramalyl-CoA lyase
VTHPVVRSALFVPASRAERIPKALAAGADAVIVDLEDAVEHLAKASARESLCDFLGTNPRARLWVRINDASTPWHDDDLKACRGKPGVAGILLPKAESLAQVRHVVQAGLSVIPILETAQGILNAGEVAATPGVARLAFGSLDYGLDMGLTPDTPGAETVLDQARVQVLLHSRAAGLAPALDGVFPGVQDQAGLAQAAGRA